jgi:hypothetical protein
MKSTLQNLLFKYAILFILIITINLSCNDSSIEGYENLPTEKISNNLYVEKYLISYGVYGETLKYFIADSSKYRIYVGSCDEKEFFNFSIEGNTVKVEKFTRRNKKLREVEKVSTEYYPIP